MFSALTPELLGKIVKAETVVGTLTAPVAHRLGLTTNFKGHLRYRRRGSRVPRLRLVKPGMVCDITGTLARPVAGTSAKPVFKQEGPC